MRIKGIHSISAALLMVIFSIAAALAALPQTINYQGYLKNSDGTPVNGHVNVSFRLYSSTSAVNPLWSGAPQGVTPQNGVYSTQIGPTNLPFDRPYYLGVTVGNDPELAPLLRLDAAPYALRAVVAESVPNGSVGTSAISDGSVTTAKIAAGAVGDAQISGTINDSKLTANMARLNAPQTFSATQTFSNGASFPVAPTFSMAAGVPFNVASTYTVTNLNADYLDGLHGAYFLNADNLSSGTLPAARLSGAYSGITATGTLSSLAVSGNTTLGGSLSFATPKTAYSNVSAPAFTPTTSSVTYGSNWSGGNDRYLSGPAGIQTLNASVGLPHGATLQNVSCRVNDASPSYTITIGLVNSTASNWVCGPATSSGSSGIQNVSTGTCTGTNTVDNINSSYMLKMFNDTACGTACSIYSCTVTYTVTSLP